MSDLQCSLLTAFYPFLSPLAAFVPPSSDRSPAFDAFLNSTLVGAPATITITPQPDEHGTPLKEVIHRAQTRLFALHHQGRRKTPLPTGTWFNPTPPNVLCYGYRPADARSEAFSMTTSGIAISNHCVNTNVTLLRQSPEWTTLLSIIGPDALITLLGTPTTAIFAPLPNACYLQLSGRPTCELTPLTTKLSFPTFPTKPSALTSTPALPHPNPTPTHRSRKRRRPHSKHPDAPLPPAPPNPRNEEQPLPSAVKHPRLSATTSAPQLDVAASTGGGGVLPRGVLRSVGRGLRATVSVSVLESPKRKAGEEGLGLGAVVEEGRARGGKRRKMETLYKPNEVLFGRTRLYHARPCKNAQGKIKYGLSSKHILSRLPTIFPPAPSPSSISPDPSPPDALDRQSRHLFKYIFPRQFNLRNPFTSPKLAWGAVEDYEDREAEIAKLGPVKTPKRLKPALELAKRMIHLEGKCRYRKLLDRYCPRKASRKGPIPVPDGRPIPVSSDITPEPRTQLSRSEISIEVSHRSQIFPHGAKEARAKVRAKPSFSDYSCSPYEVKSFVRSVVREVIPRDFWGSDSNAKVVLSHISALLRLRRYETLSVHALLQNFCVADCDWLRAPSAGYTQNSQQRANAVEMDKRRELLQEFLFWFVDGWLMDLLKTTFVVTESAKSRNRTLFFRQDDWAAVCKPLLRTIQQSMFEEIPQRKANIILKNRTLGFSFLRLLPKDTGVRPIVNLQRKPTVIGMKGQPELCKSINQNLENTFLALSYERSKDARLLGASVLGPSEVYERLKVFKNKLLLGPGKTLPKLYFVKVDVKACFDTIKQDKLLEIVEQLFSQDAYRIQKYGRVISAAGRVSKKWPKKACPENESWSFPDLAETLAEAVRHAVFSDRVVYPVETREQMVKLLREHIQCNLVKIGGRFFRQREGIPQGSVLSSLLCSLFYGHMESAMLRFTRDQSSVLLRYIDDFLFVTTKRPLAGRFLKIMDDGIPEYGCYIAAKKRLTNFDIALDGAEIVPTLTSTKDFPWCGMTINTETLEVKAEIERYNDVDICDTLTVERTKKPGEAFIFKMLQTCKMRAHLIYNDTAHNSLQTVYLNIYQSFLLVALKFHAYVREWGTDPRRRPAFFEGALEHILQFMYVAIKNRSRTKAAREAGGECDIQRSSVTWLGMHAFHRVLTRKPTAYGALLPHLARELRRPAAVVMAHRLRKVVGAPGNEFIEGPTWKR